MSSAQQMLETYPWDVQLGRGPVGRGDRRPVDVCTAGADACLAVGDVAAMVKCIRTNLDCADICETTMRVLSRQTEYGANITRAQLEACRSCGDECQGHGHAGMQHCAACAAACRRCEQASRQLINAIGR